MSLRHQIVSTKVEAQRALLAGKPMPAVAAAVKTVGKLPCMIKAAASNLAKATTAAEILDVVEATSQAYDEAKRAGRIATAKGAHDTVIAAAHRAQADALEIEAAAKRRLADEYDAAQGRGEIAGDGRPKTVPEQNGFQQPATAADVGLERKDIHEARRVRNAEKAKPGVVADALAAALDEGREPSRAVVKQAVAEALGDEPAKREKPADPLQAAWDAAGDDERAAFMTRNGLTLKKPVSPAVPTAKAKADDAPHPPVSSAAPFKPNPAKLRPHCKKPDHCGGYGRKHCRPCEIAHEEART